MIIKQKKRLCKDNNLTLVEIYPKDFKQFDEDFLYKLLINKLNEKGIDE